MTVRILTGDVRETLRTLRTGFAHCCVTSPPYWGLRDYGVDGQIGLEESPEDYVRVIVEVFRAVRRVLRDDGTLWLNLGDTYASRPNGSIGKESRLEGAFTSHSEFRRAHAQRKGTLPQGYKHKDMIGIPWMVAFALRADGWYLRSEIIWHKSNAMPESVTDRPTKAHEHLFLLSKSATYHYDHEAIKEPAVGEPDAPRNRWDSKDYEVPGQKPQKRASRAKGNAKTFRGGVYVNGKAFDNDGLMTRNSTGNTPNESGLRNKRDVWTVATAAFPEAHFATYPPELVKPCILAGCPIGGTVLDPFGGAGTTGLVADGLGRHAVLCELNPSYAQMAARRIAVAAGPLLESVVVEGVVGTAAE